MIKQTLIPITDYDYPLSAEKIADFPAAIRDQSKLLVCKDGNIIDSRFDRIAQFLDPSYLLIFNDSKVIHARLLLQNATGATIEIFCLEPVTPMSEVAQAFEQKEKVIWKCFVGNAKKWKTPLTFKVVVNNITVSVTATKGNATEDVFYVTFTWTPPEITFLTWLEAFGKMPLPPYIKRPANLDDESRYQTVFAKHDGSVAAPTAGLHFTDNLFTSLKNKQIATKWITLHVGAGTFKPVSVNLIGNHYMHKEQIVVHEKTLQVLLSHADKKIVAVGTTVVRTLESLYLMGVKLKLNMPQPFEIKQWEVYEHPEWEAISVNESLETLMNYLKITGDKTISGYTSLMIAPDYQFRIIRGLITNFHQPKSTLLLLIAAFLGEQWRDVYNHALANDYRFLSYGDANLYL